MRRARQRRTERRQNRPKNKTQNNNDHIKQLAKIQKNNNKIVEKEERKNGGIK